MDILSAFSLNTFKHYNRRISSCDPLYYLPRGEFLLENDNIEKKTCSDKLFNKFNAFSKSWHTNKLRQHNIFSKIRLSKKTIDKTLVFFKIQYR